MTRTRDEELTALRVVLARLDADPGHLRDMANAPPLTDHARHVIRWAFSGRNLAPPRVETAGDAA